MVKEGNCQTAIAAQQKSLIFLSVRMRGGGMSSSPAATGQSQATGGAGGSDGYETTGVALRAWAEPFEWCAAVATGKLFCSADVVVFSGCDRNGTGFDTAATPPHFDKLSASLSQLS